MFNSVISTDDERFCNMDLKDFYLGTPLPNPEWMKIPIRLLSKRIIELYNLESLVHKGHVYVRVDKGMYGPLQAGRIAYNYLKKLLAPYGYLPTEHTPGLWKHDSSDLMFTLIVDDFGVRYTKKSDVERLLKTFKEIGYKYSVD
mmetsp:Transcript_33456/g.51288  ORF Transcript_33456/g.51288 Transcript_33456/m.51288 type:complete len:144 (-) Transcript_33456:1250-1681(-)